MTRDAEHTPSPQSVVVPCSACETGRLNAKAAGHRDWREGVCWDHAGFDLDSPEGRTLMADLPTEPQPDLFGDIAA